MCLTTRANSRRFLRLVQRAGVALRHQMRAVILQARAAAMNDADAIPVPHGRPDIEWDEFVMA